MLSATEVKPPDETKSESLSQPDLTSSSKNPEPPCIDNLIGFFLIHLNEKSSFQQIRAVAKIAIANGKIKDSDFKKTWITDALTKLKTLNVSLTMLTIILAAIEVVALSSRISNLRSLSVFAKDVLENNNYAWLLNGARLVIETYHPKLNVNYICCPHECRPDITSIKENLIQNKVLWLVVGYKETAHLTLVRLQFIDAKLTMHVFDSVGTRPKSSGKPCDSELQSLLEDVKLQVSPKAGSDSVEFVSTGRQTDYINCFAFVLFDLATALNHFENSKKCFLDKAKEDKKEWSYCNLTEYTAFSPDFYEIAQLDAEKRKRENPKALFMSAEALVTLANNKIRFTPQNDRGGEESEEDIHIKSRQCY